MACEFHPGALSYVATCIQVESECEPHLITGWRAPWRSGPFQSSRALDLRKCKADMKYSASGHFKAPTYRLSTKFKSNEVPRYVGPRSVEQMQTTNLPRARHLLPHCCWPRRLERRLGKGQAS